MSTVGKSSFAPKPLQQCCSEAYTVLNNIVAHLFNPQVLDWQKVARNSDHNYDIDKDIAAIKKDLIESVLPALQALGDPDTSVANTVKHTQLLSDMLRPALLNVLDMLEIRRADLIAYADALAGRLTSASSHEECNRIDALNTVVDHTDMTISRWSLLQEKIIQEIAIPLHKKGPARSFTTLEIRERRA